MTDRLQPTLAQMRIYPIKSLDGLLVNSSEISTGGTLAFDRRWAIADDRGRIVNAKRTAKIHRLRSQFNSIEVGTASLQLESISIQNIDDRITHTFSLTTQLAELAQWLSRFLGFSVSLIENSVQGFPDDPDAYGPTIVSTATLETICTWFPGLDLAEVQRRFRTNLEIGGVPAFWEDRLFAASGEIVNFQLGDVQFHGINPCQRCIVPTRDSLTGEIFPQFQQTFIQQRQQTLPIEINAARFNHFYRLAINTQIPHSQAGKLLNTGDLLVVDK